MLTVPRFLKNAFEGYEVLDFKEWLTDGRIEVVLSPLEDRKRTCWKCDHPLSVARGEHWLKLEGMPIMGFRFFIRLPRYKGHCERCRKARSEKVEFISDESPHLTKDFAFWLGRLCEFAPVSRVAELVGMEPITLWRHDHARMRRMLQQYKIPDCTHISVDEVYARKKSKFEGESRANRFFTVISDLKTRKVIWVGFSCRRDALDEFFRLLGPERCSKIEAIAMDQHADYKASAEHFCPLATIVYDRFHLVQDFEEAINETRKELFEEFRKSDPLIDQLARGSNRFVFLQKASRRSKESISLINEVTRRNHRFLKLELIKERLLTLFSEPTAEAARSVFDEIGDWIWQMNFQPLMKWHRWIEHRWDTVKNYFDCRITTSLSEAINNVIKVVKRRAYGYRNMDYFRLKIMQVAGYLNSRYAHLDPSTTCT